MKNLVGVKMKIAFEIFHLYLPVNNKHRFLQIRENRFSGSKLVNPVCNARMKNKMALTDATLFSSSFSAAAFDNSRWKNDPT